MAYQTISRTQCVSSTSSACVDLVCRWGRLRCASRLSRFTSRFLSSDGRKTPREQFAATIQDNLILVTFLFLFFYFFFFLKEKKERNIYIFLSKNTHLSSHHLSFFVVAAPQCGNLGHHGSQRVPGAWALLAGAVMCLSALFSWQSRTPSLSAGRSAEKSLDSPLTFPHSRRFRRLQVLPALEVSPIIFRPCTPHSSIHLYPQLSTKGKLFFFFFSWWRWGEKAWERSGLISFYVCFVKGWEKMRCFRAFLLNLLIIPIWGSNQCTELNPICVYLLIN